MLPVHPIVEIFPPLPEDEFTNLVESIRNNGVLAPIMVWKGQIIDGRHRARACDILQIAPTLKHIDGDEAGAIQAAIAANLRRRQLAPSQVAAIAAQALPIYEEAARRRQVAGGQKAGKGRPQQVVAHLPQPVRSREQAAADFGVSPRLVQDAKTVLAASPALHDAVKGGELSVGAAVKVVRSAPAPVPSIAGAPGESDQDRLVREATSVLEAGKAIWQVFDKVRADVAKVGRAMKAALEMHAQQAGFLDARAFEHAIERAVHAIEAAAPYWVCPSCCGGLAQRANCLCCKGNGWVNRAAWDVADPQMKDAMPVKPAKGKRR